MTVLATLDRRIGLDLTGCPVAELRTIASEGRRGLSIIEALLTRVAAEAQRRENAGDAVVTGDLVRGDGELSRSRADAIAARAALSGPLPAVGDAVASGDVRPENADALAAAVGRLNPGEQARLAAHDAELATRAATDSPETFARHLDRRTRDARDRPDPLTGSSRAEREKACSQFSLGRRLNGRWWLNGDLADEWGTPINDRIHTHARTLAGDNPVTPNHYAQALYEIVTGQPDPTPGTRFAMGIGYIIDAHTLFADTPPTKPTNPPSGRASASTAPRADPTTTSPNPATDHPTGTGPSADAPPGPATGHPTGTGPSADASPGPATGRSTGAHPNAADSPGPAADGPTGAGSNGPGSPGPTDRSRATTPRADQTAGPEPDTTTAPEEGATNLPGDGADGPQRCPCGRVAETWGGHPVDPRVIRRLACDTDLWAILIGPGGEPKGAHHTHRTASRHQRLQLRALYPTCPLDGTTPFEHCEIHHVNLAHAHGGPTVLANLLPLSSRWHHRIHDLGWHLTMHPDRTLELRTPDGQLHRIVPPPAPITRQRE